MDSFQEKVDRQERLSAEVEKLRKSMDGISSDKQRGILDKMMELIDSVHALTAEILMHVFNQSVFQNDRAAKPNVSVAA
jgi:hypothetical protein